MRGTRSPRGAIAESRRIRNRGDTTNISSNLKRSVWVVNDDGHPKSPLSIERLPRYVERNISRVARVKPRFKAMARKRRAAPEDTIPFFIDKSPSEELAGVIRSRGRSLMNDSVILLESPKVTTEPNDASPKWPIKEARRQDSVDTVDLCSEEEEERLVAVKGNKRRNKIEGNPRKRRKLCVKIQDSQPPDVIVLDDEDESASNAKTSSNNTSIILESPPLKPPHRSRCKDNTQPTSSVSTVSETPDFTIPISSSSSGNGFNFRAKYLDKNSTIKDSNCKGRGISASATPGPSRNEYSESNSQKPEPSSTVGSNVFNPCSNVQQTGLRPIIIDGCNVAIAHGGNRMFSVRGLCICVEYFLRRGHNQVVALVPLHQRSKVSPQDRDVLESLKIDNHLVYTPSRFIDNRLISSYDDRYIVQYAAAVGGVIVSRDNYRDLLVENPAWRDTITNRLLMPTWVGDILMFPVDPLGKSGPSLDDFLRFPNK